MQVSGCLVSLSSACVAERHAGSRTPRGEPPPKSVHRCRSLKRKIKKFRFAQKISFRSALCIRRLLQAAILLGRFCLACDKPLQVSCNPRIVRAVLYCTTVPYGGARNYAERHRLMRRHRVDEGKIGVATSTECFHDLSRNYDARSLAS